MPKHNEGASGAAAGRRAGTTCGIKYAVAALALLLAGCGSSRPAPVTIQNFNADGTAVLRLDTAGDPIDAHDGGIWQDPNSGTFYLYGTAYACGFGWFIAGSPFCGFRVYSSPDGATWTPQGLLFDPAGWQAPCGGRADGPIGGGCFRPRMLFNRLTSQYVLWFTGPGAASADYWAMTCAGPTGPCSAVADDPQTFARSHLGHPSDFNFLQDADGAAYVVYNSGGALWIEQLAPSYLAASGKVLQIATTEPEIEAPAVFVRNGVYYALYGRYCGFCPGIDTSYSLASAPLGPWTAGGELSPNSCGGQPSNVASLRLHRQPVYLYESDLWLGTANETAAGRFVAPLSFSGAAIDPIVCSASVTLP
jgi:glycosyl hydrolase family 43